LNNDIKSDEDYIIKVLGQGGEAGKGTESRQLPKDAFEKDVQDGNVYPPLYNPIVWAFLLEQNTRLKKLVEAMANNCVGLGWEIVPRKEEESYIEANREAITKERELLVEFFENINPELPFTEVMKQVKTDEESTGQSWLEVTRTKKGDKPAQLFHLPSHTVRVSKSTMGRERYVQMRPSNPNERVYFKKFGEEASLDANTGKWEDEAAVTVPATEVIQFKLYTPRSSFYGVPRVVSAAPAIAGNRLAARRNVAFFENDATPRMAIVVNGGELADESMTMIEEFLDARAKGPGNAGRVMVIQGRGSDNLMGDSKDVGIQLIPLTVGVEDDASFTKYMGQNNEEIREAFGIGQIFIGTSDDVNRAVALAMKQVTVEQVFEPEASRYEYRINRCIVDLLGVQHTKLQFKRTRTTDMVAESQALMSLAIAGGVTPNDIRDFLNKSRFNAKWADTPLQVTRAGLLEDSEDPLATLFTVYADALVANQTGAEGGGDTSADGDNATELAAVGKQINLESMGDIMSELQGQADDLATKLRTMGYTVDVAEAESA
jgi:PBSX family phage portal protein